MRPEYVLALKGSGISFVDPQADRYLQAAYEEQCDKLETQ